MLRLLKIITALILAVCLCGCSVSDDDHLLKPPRSLGEKEGIKSAIEAYVKGKISYKFPISGDYKSAIIMKDMDDDGKEEAVAFFKNVNVADESTHIAMLDHIDGSWLVINDIQGPGATIDRVVFCNLDGNSGLEVVVGWSIYSNVKKTVRIYSFTGADFNEIPASYLEPETLKSTDITYNELVYGDFDGDSKDEVVTLELASATNQTPATARLIEYYTNVETGEPFTTVTWTTGVDNTVTSYLSVKVCRISDASAVTDNSDNDSDGKKGLYAVVADGLNSQNQVVTDVVCWDSVSGTFTAPFFDNATGTAPAFTRNNGIISQDIDGDGLTELPGSVLLPTYSETSEEKMYMISWNRYVSDSESRFVSVLNTIYNTDSGYYLAIPDDWMGKITAKQDKGSKTLYIYDYDYKLQTFGAELFRIHEATGDEMKKLEKQGFIRLSTSGEKVYCALLQNENSGQVKVNPETVSSIFRIVE